MRRETKRMMSSVGSQPVYVTGMMESGKSTLLSLLDGHPSLLVYPQEPHFGRMLEGNYGTPEELYKGFFSESPLSHHGRLRGIESIQGAVFDWDKYRRCLEEALKHDIAPGAVMMATMRAFAQATGQSYDSCKYWVFNEPNRARLVPWFFSTFPYGRVIHILRDPREHYRSVKAHHAQARQPMGRLSALHFSMDWSLGASQAVDNHSRFGPQRYLILRFEDMGKDREQAMQRVSKFLDIEFVPSLTVPSKVGVSASPAADSIEESEIGKWLRPISTHERWVIESCCAEVMSRPGLGYHIDTPKLVAKLTRGFLTRMVHGVYYGKRCLKGIVSPTPLHEIYRIDKMATNPKRFSL